jgi:hypothetical protein
MCKYYMWHKRNVGVFACNISQPISVHSGVAAPGASIVVGWADKSRDATRFGAYLKFKRHYVSKFIASMVYLYV